MKKKLFKHIGVFSAFAGLVILLGFSGCSKEQVEPIKQTEQKAEKKLKAGATVVDVFCGHYTTFALKSDGTLWATGENGLGELGTGDNVDRNVFTPVLTNVKKVSSCRFHTLALKNDGTVWATGYNSKGQLGTGDKTNRYSFVQVASNIKDIATGNLHSMILTQNAVLKTVGWNQFGQLGTGDNIDRLSFTPVLTGVDKIAVGWNDSYAKMGDCSLYATSVPNLLGSNNTFVKVINNNVHDVSSSGSHVAVLMTNGSLQAIGDNQDGELGIGDNIDRNSFVQVINSNVKSISASGPCIFVSLYYPYNQLKCTGNNFYGNLGLGDNIDRNVFTVTVPENVSKFSCNYWVAFYVKTDGTLWATGIDANQLGLGGISETNTWLQVSL